MISASVFPSHDVLKQQFPYTPITSEVYRIAKREFERRTRTTQHPGAFGEIITGTDFYVRQALQIAICTLSPR